MRLKEIYKLAIRMGKIADPRGEEEVENVLKKARKEYDELKEEKRKRFDTERLSNPYSDTRILHGNPELNVKSVLAGIDLEVSEVLLADRLREKGKRIDLLVSHHPEGKALAALHEVMHLQEDVWYRLGVPINIAESLMKDRIMEVERTLAPVNHNRAVDAARLLDMAFMCVHTPADNLVTKYLSMYLDEKKPATVGDLMENLLRLPEYDYAARINSGPKIFLGAENRRVGKIYVDMTGGTEGPVKGYAELARAGVGTIVAMHMTEKHREEAEKNHLNVIVAGHMASDSLGLNLFMDELEKAGIEIMSCSGFVRVSRAGEDKPWKL